MGEKNQGSFLLLFLILTTLSPQTHLLSDVGIEEKEKRKRRREARSEGEPDPNDSGVEVGVNEPFCMCTQPCLLMG